MFVDQSDKFGLGVVAIRWKHSLLKLYVRLLGFL